jgi:putative ABC transport system permease protein
MKMLRLLLAYLVDRPGLTLFNVLLTALSVALVVVAVQLQAQTEDRLRADAAGIDLVLGAKGSPLQIVLASVYHLDVPPGNIKLADAEEVLADPRVKQGIPLSLGDSYRGARIVGTTTGLIEHYGGALAAGALWQKPLEAVLGADVAQRTGLTIGSTFAGTHGLSEGGSAHGDHPYRVVGILKPSQTALDRLILTDLESVWKVHDHGDHEGHDHDAKASSQGKNAAATSASTPAKDSATADAHAGHDHDHAHGDEREITAMLLTYASPLAAASLPREINAKPGLVAASPALETGRLMALIGGATQALWMFAVILVLAAAASIFLAINAAFTARRYDLAVIRMMGAKRGELLLLTVMEGVVLAGAGAILGMAMAYLCLFGLGVYVNGLRELAVIRWLWHPVQSLLLVVVPVLGGLAAVVPAVRAMRIDVARQLAQP